METKRCTKCEIVKAVECFGKNGNRLHPNCKDCRKKFNKKYREANKDAISAIKKKHYQANKDAILAKNKEHYESNKDAILARIKEYKNSNTREFYNHWHTKLNRALRNGYNTDISICGMSADDLKAHLEVDSKSITTHTFDHIIPYKAFVKWGDIDNNDFSKRAYCNWRNIQLLTHDENSSKGDKCTKIEFLTYVAKFARSL